MPRSSRTARTPFASPRSPSALRSSRRDDRHARPAFFLKSSGLALAAFGFAPGFLQRALASTDPVRRKVLVTIFQRGAVDGLSMIPPVAEGLYYDLRPAIAIPRPGRGEGAALTLDGHFALHPSLARLEPLWTSGALAVVHAVGSPDPTRSHFDAQDYLDAGTPGVKSTPDGWLNRALQARPKPAASPFRAVAMQSGLPRSLAGRAGALAMNTIGEYGLHGGAGAAASRWSELYSSARDPRLRAAGGEAFESARALREAGPGRFAPANGAAYPAAPLGRRLREIAQLVKADVGLEVAATDCGGWDTHAGQGAAQGPLANRLRELGDALGAFATDLGDRMADVCVVTMTEFGRTVKENGSRGTDHGHGSAMLVLGGAVKGRRVVARWKGLDDANLYEGRDLAVTTDHREVLSEVLYRHMGIADLSTVFPSFASSGSQRVSLF
ncbi:MAG: DUF1501 domain-containing protein [Thermoanaerobaculia bacterium]